MGGTVDKHLKPAAGVILLAMLAVYLTIQVTWIALYRSPMLFDIDEAGGKSPTGIGTTGPW
jgi:hypothetical protein